MWENRFVQFIVLLMMWQEGPKYLAVAGICYIIVTLIQLCDFLAQIIVIDYVMLTNKISFSN